MQLFELVDNATPLEPENSHLQPIHPSSLSSGNHQDYKSIDSSVLSEFRYHFSESVFRVKCRTDMDEVPDVNVGRIPF